MKKTPGRKIHSDEGISKLGVGSNLRLILRGTFENFDGESPSYIIHYITYSCNRKPNEQVASDKRKQSVCCRREDNFNNLKDAELERIKLETKYKCNFVIQEDIGGQIYYIFPDPDDARHKEIFFKYTYMDDPQSNILKY